MCEILGITSKKLFAANELLDSFFQHGNVCRDGWGLAVFRGDGVTMEKEPVCALESSYLHNRLTRAVEANNLFAHIRKATLGRVEYANCHPFIWDDAGGRTWTLVHNGTIFEGKEIAPYLEAQEGSTDSERILLYLLDRIRGFLLANGHPPDEEERFRLVDELILRISPGNKLNLLLFDGAVMYVHTNCPGTLYIWQDEEKYLFATVPIRMEGWKEMEQNQLFAYKNGALLRSGTLHRNTFDEKAHDYTSLYAAFAEL